MVDLHSHTTKSDGSLSPAELVALACRKGLKTLAITDHDTLEGYDEAVPYATASGLDLVCGVELGTKFHGYSIHVLGYFFQHAPGDGFRDHLHCLQTSRRERNSRLAGRLRELGLDVAREEAEKLGQSQTGRPHFARLLIQKGYVNTVREAFDRYLDESAPGYVERRDPSLENVIRWIHEAGGLASWAHPVRMVHQSGLPVELLFRELADLGMDAIEAYHSDHNQQVQSELDRRLVEAKALKLEFVDVINKELQDATKTVDKRILLHRLLNDLQWFYSKRVHYRSASRRLMLRVSLLFMVALVTLFLVLFIQFFAHPAPAPANGQVAAAGPGAAASAPAPRPPASSEVEKPGGDK